MIFRHRAVSGILIAGVLFLLAAVPSAHAAFPGKNGKLAFISARDDPRPFNDCLPNCNYEIYSINPDGTGRARLTNSVGQDGSPAWSPDGTKIAFASGRDDPSPSACGTNCQIEIYKMNADGSGPTRLTNNPAGDTRPDWSPDGAKIAFWSTRDQSNGEIYTMNADGTGVTRLTSNVSVDRDPAWSPNGTKIAFVSTRNGNPEIYVMNADGTNQVRLTNNPQPDEYPNWSPDGSRVAFRSSDCSVDCTHDHIFVMNADGSGLHQVFTDPFVPYGFDDDQPAWSPDGAWMVFDSDTNGTFYDIYVMNLKAGGPARQLTGDDHNFDPDWQPIPVNSYARPRGATPLRASLAIAYKACTSPNREHGPPLVAGSCTPPAMASDYLTVGTGDANGRLPRSEGFVRLDAVLDKPATPADESDVNMRLAMSDVFTKALDDYTGELRATVAVQATDKDNTPNPGGPGAATTNEFPLAFDATCTPTAETTIGSDCAAATSANALVAGIVKGGLRSIWELRQVQVFDGGSDGLAVTSSDNTLFATEGVFVP